MFLRASHLFYDAKNEKIVEGSGESRDAAVQSGFSGSMTKIALVVQLVCVLLSLLNSAGNMIVLHTGALLFTPALEVTPADDSTGKNVLRFPSSCLKVTVAAQPP